MKLSIDPCKITAIVKLYDNTPVTSPLIIKFLTSFLAVFPYAIHMMVLGAKNNLKKTFSMLVILKNHELQITVSLLRQN